MGKFDDFRDVVSYGAEKLLALPAADYSVVVRVSDSVGLDRFGFSEFPKARRISPPGVFEAWLTKGSVARGGMENLNGLCLHYGEYVRSGHLKEDPANIPGVRRIEGGTQNEEVVLTPLSLDFKTVYHTALETLNDRKKARKPIDQAVLLEKEGIIGVSDIGYASYLSQDIDFSVSHVGSLLMGRGKALVFEVDVQKLMEKRGIYVDPESCHDDIEAGKSFFVLGGIPGEAIRSLRYIEVISFKEEVSED